jgi:hypothetical protein
MCDCDCDGQRGALETDIHGKGGVLERIDALEEAQNAIADDVDEVIWYLEENRNGTKVLSEVLAMLAQVVERLVPKHADGTPDLPLGPQCPEIFVPPQPDHLNRAARRRIARNGHQR